MLAVTLLLSLLATGVKMTRRSGDHSPLPLWSIGLSAVCLLLFVLQLTGLLAV